MSESQLSELLSLCEVTRAVSGMGWSFQTNTKLLKICYFTSVNAYLKTLNSNMQRLLPRVQGWGSGMLVFATDFYSMKL